MTRLVLFWVVSLVVVALATLAFAQGRRVQGSQILSGSDIGFRVEGRNFNNKPFGTWMVRVDGEWVEVGSGAFPVQ